MCEECTIRLSLVMSAFCKALIIEARGGLPGSDVLMEQFHYNLLKTIFDIQMRHPNGKFS